MPVDESVRRVVAGTVEEIPPGGRKLVVPFRGRAGIGVFNIGGAYYALRNLCPHKLGPLCTGRVSGRVVASAPPSTDAPELGIERDGEIIRCPWHGWEFDVRTGQSWFDPTRTRVRAYEVSVTPGAALAEEGAAPAPGMQKGPYVAETYPVSVENRYVLVEIPE